MGRPDLRFQPNGLNRSVNEGTLDIVIDLRDITSRCYGAREMSERIRAAAVSAHIYPSGPS